MKQSPSEEKDTIDIEDENCRCPTGESQGCMHIAGLLLTLAEVTQTERTSQVCVWSRPSGKAQLLTELDFGQASSTGYQPYSGAILDTSALVQELQTSGLSVGFGEYIEMEHERQSLTDATSMQPLSNAKRALISGCRCLFSLCKDAFIKVNCFTLVSLSKVDDLSLVYLMNPSLPNH